MKLTLPWYSTTKSDERYVLVLEVATAGAEEPNGASKNMEADIGHWFIAGHMISAVLVT